MRRYPGLGILEVSLVNQARAWLRSDRQGYSPAEAYRSTSHELLTFCVQIAPAVLHCFGKKVSMSPLRPARPVCQTQGCWHVRRALASWLNADRSTIARADAAAGTAAGDQREHGRRIFCAVIWERGEVTLSGVWTYLLMRLLARAAGEQLEHRRRVCAVYWQRGGFKDQER